MICEFCGDPIEPGQPFMYAVSGWEEPRAVGGANQIHLRHRLPDRFAHSSCVEAAKPRQRERRREAEPALDLSRRYRAAKA